MQIEIWQYSHSTHVLPSCLPPATPNARSCAAPSIRPSFPRRMTLPVLHSSQSPAPNGTTEEGQLLGSGHSGKHTSGLRYMIWDCVSAESTCNQRIDITMQCDDVSCQRPRRPIHRREEIVEESLKAKRSLHDVLNSVLRNDTDCH